HRSPKNTPTPRSERPKSRRGTAALLAAPGPAAPPEAGSPSARLSRPSPQPFPGRPLARGGRCRSAPPLLIGCRAGAGPARRGWGCRQLFAVRSAAAAVWRWGGAVTVPALGAPPSLWDARPGPARPGPLGGAMDRPSYLEEDYSGLDGLDDDVFHSDDFGLAGNAGYRLHVPPVGFALDPNLQEEPQEGQQEARTEVQIARKLQCIADQFHRLHIQRHQQNRNQVWWQLFLFLHNLALNVEANRNRTGQR
uniref:Bcl2 modifying factor n=1 Tax=Pavo cristatus TaxID=9049 RepID=A0A8C9L8G8_PAVCR